MPSEAVIAFASETQVFGLNLFYRRRDLFDTVFWLAFVIIFSGYTIKSLVPVCQSYLDEEVTTLVQQQRNESFSFPAPAICFYMIPANSSRDLSITDDVIDQYSQTGDLSKSNFVHAVALLGRLFAGKYDSVIASLYNRSDRESLEKYHKPAGDIGADLRAFQKKPTIRLSDFADFVLKKFCLAMNLYVWSARTDSAMQPGCEKGTVDFDVLVGQNGICINLDPALFVFSSAIDHIRLKFNTTAIRDEFGFEVQSALFITESTGFESGSRDFDSQFEIVPQDRRTHYVRMSAVYKNLDLARRHCDDDRRRSLFCADRCELAAFNDSFGCWPFASQGLQLTEFNEERRVRPCEAEDYLKFGSSVEGQNLRNFHVCHAMCLPACSTPVFEITGEKTSGESTRTVAGISVASYVYPLIEEKLANDFETFLAAFGGGLSLWLGVSFGSLLHILVFWIRELIKVARRKSTRLKTNARNELPLDIDMAQHTATTDEGNESTK